MTTLLVALMLWGTWTMPQQHLITDITSSFDRTFLQGADLVITDWEGHTGAQAYCLTDGSMCVVMLGQDVWRDELTTRIVVGHELGHTFITARDVACFQQVVPDVSSDSEIAEEEAVTVISYKAQRISMRDYEPSIRRRRLMRRWWLWLRATHQGKELPCPSQ